jgi:hypothetical protein
VSLERKHPKYARAWPDRQPAKRRYYSEPPEDVVVSHDYESRAPATMLFDLAQEIRASFDTATGLDRPRRREALRNFLAVLEGIAAYCAGNGIEFNLANEILRVPRAIYDTTMEENARMDTQAVIEAMRREHEQTRHELTLAICKARDGETPAEAAERFLVESDADGEDSMTS